jgi:hypothetical protein
VPDGGFDRLPRLLVHDPEDLLDSPPVRLGMSPTGELFSHWVEQYHPSLGVGGDDPVPDRPQRHAEAFGLEYFAISGATEPRHGKADGKPDADEDGGDEEVRRSPSLLRGEP